MPEFRGAGAPKAIALLLLVAAASALAAAKARAETVLITGANSGIGLEFTRQYAELGWTVIATHRRSAIPDTLAEVTAAHDKVVVERMDVTDAAQIASLAAKLADTPIDILINNAGVYNDRTDCDADECPGDWSTQDFGNLRYGLFDTIMAVNVRGPLMVSEAFVEQVAASERKLIVSISSTNGTLTEPLAGAGGIFYRSSKAALNKAMQQVARALREREITVLLMHPGAVATERQAYLAEFPGMLDTAFSVTSMIATLEDITLADTGRFIQYDGSTAPW